MAGYRHGKNTVLYLGKHDLGTHLREVTFTPAQAEAETTTFGSSFRDFIPGFTDTEVNVEGLFERTTGGANGTGSDNIMTDVFGSTTDPVLTYGPEGDTVGRKAQMITILNSAYELGSDINEAVRFAGTLRGTTAWDSGRWVRPLSTAAGSTGGSTGVVDRGTTGVSTGGAIGHLHVTAVGGTTGSVTVAVQHSSDNATWADYMTFTATTQRTAERKSSTADLKRYVRERRTTATRTATYTVALARR